MPESQVWIADKSRSTYENAKYGAELVKGRGISRIVLVTDAYHMPRAEGCFRKQGLSVAPAGALRDRASCSALRLAWSLICKGECPPNRVIVLCSRRNPFS